MRTNVVERLDFFRYAAVLKNCPRKQHAVVTGTAPTPTSAWILIFLHPICLQVKERYNTRIVRQTERELIPLGKGTVEKVKVLRTARLRKKVSTIACTSSYV